MMDCKGGYSGEEQMNRARKTLVIRPAVVANKAPGRVYLPFFMFAVIK